MDQTKTYQISIVYGYADKQTMLSLNVDAGTSAEEAIIKSGIQTLWPEIDLAHIKIGIFGKKVTLNTPVKDGDRIELYRPLTIDPKQARKLRATKQLVKFT